jgi:hypothetical protein
VSEREIAGILAVRYSALARESAEHARESVQLALRRLDVLVRNLCDSISSGKSMGMREILVEVSQALGVLRAADESLSEALSYVALARRNAVDALGHEIKPEACTRFGECELSECKPETCKLFALRLL